MQLVLGAYQEFQIRKLASIYRTISISEVTRVTTSAETGTSLPNDTATETLILDMIKRLELHASVARPSGSSAVLTFKHTSPVLSESDVQQNLTDSMERIKSMTKDIQSTDRRLTHDKEYLKWAFKQKKFGSTGFGDGYSAEEVGWTAGQDEDLMSN